MTMTDVLGLGERKVWKFYSGEDRKRRRMSMSRFEQWLGQRGLTVLDAGDDEHGEFMFVTTDDPELAVAIEAIAREEQRDDCVS